MTTPRSLCVFCGSQSGNDPVYEKAAADFGKLIARAKIRLIYGGGGLGLMGTLARAALDGGAEVIGVMPRFLRAREVQQNGLSKLILTETLTERKLVMTQLSDAIAVLPGGFGTLDELTEILSWRNLNVIDKPIVIVDVAQYWEPFFAFLDHAIRSDFASLAIKANYKIVDGVGKALGAAGLGH